MLSHLIKPTAKTGHQSRFRIKCGMTKKIILIIVKNNKMKKIILYIAQSLDGFIARPDGNLDWLTEGNDDLDFGYNDFLDTIDITIMGGKTYRDILAFDEFPYKNQTNYVFSRNNNFPKNEYVNIVNDNFIELINKLKHQAGKDIWLVGGSEINTIFLENNLIDKIYIFIKSVAIGNGIPLFSKSISFTKNFKLISTKQFGEKFIMLEYDKI
jgi:dihydrofolate reductase